MYVFLILIKIVQNYKIQKTFNYDLEFKDYTGVYLEYIYWKREEKERRVIEKIYFKYI